MARRNLGVIFNEPDKLRGELKRLYYAYLNRFPYDESLPKALSSDTNKVRLSKLRKYYKINRGIEKTLENRYLDSGLWENENVARLRILERDVELLYQICLTYQNMCYYTYISRLKYPFYPDKFSLSYSIIKARHPNFVSDSTQINKIVKNKTALIKKLQKLHQENYYKMVRMLADKNYVLLRGDTIY